MSKKGKRNTKRSLLRNSNNTLFDKNEFWLVLGVATGLLFMVMYMLFIYPITGSIFLDNLHIDHLYVGLIITVLTFLLYLVTDLPENVVFVLFFIIGFGMGVFLHDLIHDYILTLL
jgi:hypothetical protein